MRVRKRVGKRGPVGRAAHVGPRPQGDLQALVVQNPLLMGYLGVMTAVKHLRGEKVEKRIDTGVALVTHENMNQPEMQALLKPPIEQYLK